MANDIPTRKDGLYLPGTLNPHIWSKGANQLKRPGLLKKAESMISGGSMGGGTLESRLEQIIDFVEGMGWDPGSNGPYNAQVLAPYVSAAGAVGYITIQEMRDLGCTSVTNWLTKYSSKSETVNMLPAVYATIPELDVGRPTPQAHSGGPALGVNGDALAIRTYRLYIGDISDPPTMPHDGSIIEVDFFDKDSNSPYGLFKSIIVDADIGSEAYNYNVAEEPNDSPQQAFNGSGTGADGNAPTTIGENERDQAAAIAEGE